MYEGDLRAAGVEICNNLAPRAEGEGRPGRARVGLLEKALLKLAALSTRPEVVVIEHLSELRRGYDAQRGNGHAVLD